MSYGLLKVTNPWALGHPRQLKYNETSHFTGLLQPLDLDGAVVTFDDLHTVRANLDWLAGEKNGHYIAGVKRNQPLLYARVKALPWQQVPAGSLTRDTGHGRLETRTLKTAHVSGLDFPRACQAIKITRRACHQAHPYPREPRTPDRRMGDPAGPQPADGPRRRRREDRILDPGPRCQVHCGIRRSLPECR